MELSALNVLTDRFRSLPGIGRKTASRLALALVMKSDEEAQAFADAILTAKRRITPCPVCFSLCQDGICPICSDEGRDKGIICVVEDTKSAAAFAEIRNFRGVFHVLGGNLSPIDGIGPDQLRVRELAARIQSGDVREVILATGATLEGETTASYLSRVLKDSGVKVTRLAYGIPVGAELEFADELTLFRALDGRREV